MALAVGGVLLGASTFWFTRQEINEVFDEQLKQHALSVRTHYRGQGVPPPNHQTTPDLDDSGLVTQIWSLDKHQVFLSFPTADIPWADGEGYQTLTTPQGAWRVYAERSPTHLIQAAQLMSVREDLAVDTAVEVLLPNLVVVLVLTALMLAYALRQGLKPLTQTTADIGHRSASSLTPIATASLPTELQPLVTSVNALMTRLAKALLVQRRFTADAAHALRTPLTALRLQVQGLATASDEATRKEALGDIRRGLDRATHLIEQLLQLSRLEPDTSEHTASDVDLAALVKSVVTDMGVFANARGIDLGAEIETAAYQSTVVRGDVHHLRILLNNLVDNALRYTPRGGKVDVALRAAPPGVLLEVADIGPGIALEEQERVFDRFYRGTTVHGDDATTTGTGLGLAIVKEIAQRHGARIELVDGLPSSDGTHGLRVRVVFDDTRGAEYEDPPHPPMKRSHTSPPPGDG